MQAGLSDHQATATPAMPATYPGPADNVEAIRLALRSWPEVEAYLEHFKGVIIPLGSTEQHGPTGAIGTIDDGPDVELDATPSGTVETTENDDESEAEAEGVVITETEDRSGVSWGSKKRQEAEELGRKKRLAEKKYNIPEWRRTVSRINSYEHQDISPFGANERMTKMELPPLRNNE